MNGYNDLYKPPGWDEWFVLQGDPINNQVNDDGRSVTLAGHSTDVFANEASDFIRRSSANPAPFFVMVGTKAPHRPAGGGGRATRTASPIPRCPVHPTSTRRTSQTSPSGCRPTLRLSQTEIDDMQTLYRERLRSMLSVEDLLEQTIATLQETGELDNTYIFFTSDNGFHLGEHRLPRGKRTLVRGGHRGTFDGTWPRGPSGDDAAAAGHKQRLCAHHRRPGRGPYPRVRRREVLRPAAHRLTALLLAHRLSWRKER